MGQLLKPFSECLVLIVDDDPFSCSILSSMLEPYFPCAQVSSGREALAFCEGDQPPDVVLLDMEMPGMNGIDVCTSLKCGLNTKDIPVVFVTAEGASEAQLRCWEAGATDFVVKPVMALTLIQRVRNHLLNKLRMESLARLSQYDQLTGVRNRTYLEQETPNLLAQLVRDKAPLSVMMIDIDHFKQLNDLRGHLYGDVCLKEIANALEKTVSRPFDTVIRYGGEEFLILLPYTTLEGAEFISGNLFSNVARCQLAHPAFDNRFVSVSAGLSGCEMVMNTELHSLIEQADRALYQAKAAGRGRSRVYTPGAEAKSARLAG